VICKNVTINPIYLTYTKVCQYLPSMAASSFPVVHLAEYLVSKNLVVAWVSSYFDLNLHQREVLADVFLRIISVWKVLLWMEYIRIFGPRSFLSQKCSSRDALCNEAETQYVSWIPKTGSSLKMLIGSRFYQLVCQRSSCLMSVLWSYLGPWSNLAPSILTFSIS
jgi:hypothetical protein